MSAWVVFTDLDGTLLDAESYSFVDATPALAELRLRGVPVVPCTSKTAGETRHFRGLLGLLDPFVVEGGGAIYVPQGYFGALPGPVEVRGDCAMIRLTSVDRRHLLRELGRLQQFTENALRPFADLPAAEIARVTGLPLELARLAQDREFDEPFELLRGGEALATRLVREARAHGLRLSQGGRFYHLHGDFDKGQAVERLKRLFSAKVGAVRTLAVGDSAMDLPMLVAADEALAVARPDGTHDPRLCAALPRLRRVALPGPAGWSRGVLQVLAEEGTR